MLRYAFDPSLRLGVLEYSGEIDYATMSMYMESIWEDPECDSSYSAICDFRKAKLIMSHEEVLNVFYQIATDERSLKGPSALIITTPMETALGFLFQKFARREPASESPKLNVQIFYEWENACGFVDCPNDKSVFKWKTVE